MRGLNPAGDGRKPPDDKETPRQEGPALGPRHSWSHMAVQKT